MLRGMGLRRGGGLAQSFRRGLIADVDFLTGRGRELLTVTSTSGHNGTIGPRIPDHTGAYVPCPSGLLKGWRGLRVLSGIAGSPPAGWQTEANGSPYWSLGGGWGMSWRDASGAPLSGVSWWGPQPATTNSFWNSHAPATQTRSLTAGTYTSWLAGTGSVAISGGPTGTASAGSPVTFTLASTTSVTFTVTGSPTFVQVVNRGADVVGGLVIETGAAAVTVNAETVTVPFPTSADWTAVVDIVSTAAYASNLPIVSGALSATSPIRTSSAGNRALRVAGIATNTTVQAPLGAARIGARVAGGAASARVDATIEAVAGTPGAMANPVGLGVSPTGSAPNSDPRITRVRFWNRALSDAEFRAA